MKRSPLVAATFSAFSLLFAQPSLAEESSTFVARNVALQQHAQNAAHEQAIAKQTAPSESEQAKTSSAESAQDS
ncbi:hypothetical protein D3879_15310 [Pseudomonas cavernicola]|uniref:Secreted protein n=1 Tax=Pseudomonas cavernicola TaxID=2320866 RepID=A0A418XF99_9PSED|nr:hypothetical protein [Pseudomonas cavernicola]RJG11038.1 hypothetical protein D3879_15310 [Pseudomonas cavernicola]